MRKSIEIIGFDADDTLWLNEPYYRETEDKFCELLSEYNSKEYITKELFKFEMQNLSAYGYGIKSFTLSMIETAVSVSNNSLNNSIINQIIILAKEMINKPVVLLDGIEQVLKSLTQDGFKLIVATKGDLLDQERKLSKSGLDKYFHHIEIMSDKKEDNYLKLLSHLDILPANFLMVGNSMKSDIIPVKNIGGCAVYVPFHTTWIHEEVDPNQEISDFHEIKNISELPDMLKS